MPTEQEPRTHRFVAARQHLQAATEARNEILRWWNSQSDDESCDWQLRSPAPGILELWASRATPNDAASGMDEAAHRFLDTIKAAFDTAVYEAAKALSGTLWPVPPEKHILPLCMTEEDFTKILDEGYLNGLRPDLVTDLRAVQPYQVGDVNEPSAAKLLLHLHHAMETASDAGSRLTETWVGDGPVAYRGPADTVISDPTVDKPGTLGDERRIGHCCVSPTDRTDFIRVLPNQPLDLILNAAPWPTDCDDNLGHRTWDLILLATRLISHFERAVSTPPLLQRIGSLNNGLPVISESPWRPISPHDDEQAADIRRGLASSDVNLATYRNAEGVLVLLRFVQGHLLGREIPQAAIPMTTGQGFGTDVELATLGVAQDYALPDFVLHPAQIAKGAAVREVGDGTILTGRRGLAVQVKAREGEPQDAARATRWLQKKAKEALKQARGTIRTMSITTDLQLDNLRGRKIRIDGANIAWVPVAVLDHPAPPTDVRFDPTIVGVGVVLLRRDWDFLWSQLQSASAVVDYLHRILPLGNVCLGEEATRYYELADADQQAPPAPSGVAETLGGTRIHGPQLPQEPAGSHDQLGHAVFRQILEDIATSPLSGDEEGRLELLSLIDRMAVDHRQQLGRLLLRRLDRCAQVAPDALMAQHRVFFIDGGRLHIVFSICSSLSGYIREMYRTWIEVRRQDFLQASDIGGTELPWTVGVLLTPRPTGDRFWDTSVIATNAEPTFSTVEHAHLRQIFADAWLDEPPII